MKTFDLICPVYNEQEAVPLFFARVQAVFGTLEKDHDCRLMFIDNGSADRPQELVRARCDQHERVGLVVMSRNLGYQCSVECGVRTSTADPGRSWCTTHRSCPCRSRARATIFSAPSRRTTSSTR